MIELSLEPSEPASEIIVAEPERVTQFPCGHEYVWPAWSQVDTDGHQARCRACKVIGGKSRARVGNQNFVAALFVAGVDGCRSKNGNLRSDAGVLSHYGTVEAVRTATGKIIRNTQCWAAGWASCPRIPGVNARLPLSTLGTLFFRPDARNIEVLDVAEDDAVLFRIDARHFLFGWDGRAPFLCELPGTVTTVETARDELIPDEARTRPVLLRQGDLFFAATTRPRNDELIDVRMKARYKCSAVTRFERRLVRPSILATNHTAGEVAVTTRGVLVRGTILHQRREHPPLKLGERWHLAFKNTALNSWQVPRRGRAGGRD